jgi:hypothetical protein
LVELPVFLRVSICVSVVSVLFAFDTAVFDTAAFDTAGFDTAVVNATVSNTAVFGNRKRAQLPQF